MHWTIQHNEFQEKGIIDLENTLDHLGISYSNHKVVPFVGELHPDIHVEDGRVICIGSYSMWRVAKKKGWTPGVYNIVDFDYKHQTRCWGAFEMLNSDFIACKFSDVIDAMGSREEVFLRPINDSKNFAGYVTTKEPLQDWVYKVVVLKERDKSEMTGDTIVMVSDPKNIMVEYRIWIVDHEVVAWSEYKRGSRVLYREDVDEDVIQYARNMAFVGACRHAPDTYVMDIAKTSSGFKIIECNNLNAAGLYACNVGRLIEALETKEAPCSLTRTPPLNTPVEKTLPSFQSKYPY